MVDHGLTFVIQEDLSFMQIKKSHIRDALDLLPCADTSTDTKTDRKRQKGRKDLE